MDGEVLALYQRIAICRQFPAYRFSDLDDETAIPLLRALDLIGIEVRTRANLAER